MISQPSSIWQIIAYTQGQKNIDLTLVEKTLGQTLLENTDQSNEFFQFYTGKPVQLAGNVAIHKINLRSPRSRASASEGALVVW